MHDGPRFANSVERSFAQLLDALGVEWQYEPKTFYNPDGRAFFKPDFYLPQRKLYVELSAARTSAGRKTARSRKNKKMRLMAKYHPRVKVLVLFRSDIETALLGGADKPADSDILPVA